MVRGCLLEGREVSAWLWELNLLKCDYVHTKRDPAGARRDSSFLLADFFPEEIKQ